ncbi:hydrogenase [Candidatus Bathyarchaeota archaeon]|nr:hydrogenase [Candidatus Bathyarchaeota archaeon]
MVFQVGKIPSEILRSIVFRNLGMMNDRLLVGPGIGEDGAVVRFGNRALVLSTDPITGTASNVGWFSVHINANDVATFGAKPKWYLCSIMLPKGSRENELRGIMKQIDSACTELGVTVIGGHCEVTPFLKRPILVGFILGETRLNRYVTSAGASVGNVLMMTKTVGIEGTTILATDTERILRKHLKKGVIKRAQNLYKKISVVQEALMAMEVGGVTAMHDPTEGGILCGIWELSEASNIGVRVYRDRIPISSETKSICKILKIDPFRLMSSGSLLIAAKKSLAPKIIKRLSGKQVPISVIGEFTKRKNGRKLLSIDESFVELKPPFPDDVYTVFSNLR